MERQHLRNCWIQGASARMRELLRATSYHEYDGTAQAWLAGWDAADTALCKDIGVGEEVRTENPSKFV